MKEALFYEKKDNLTVCKLCPHQCHLTDTKIGKCKMRQHINGKLYSLNYGNVAAIQIDPIEKKPLHSFMPGTKTLSIGSVGCNFSCVFCQNHHLAHAKDFALVSKRAPMTPEQIVSLALEHKTPSISYTYNEPTIFYEFVCETAKLAKKQQLKNVMVTNGFIEEEPLRQLLQYIDAMNIDLKSFVNDCYASYVGGMLEPVKRTISIAAKQKHIHVEITTLIVTGMNDQIAEIEDVAKWLASINPKLPLHLARYFPNYRYHEPATNLQFMQEAKDVAKKYLEYVSLGNM